MGMHHTSCPHASHCSSRATVTGLPCSKTSCTHSTLLQLSSSKAASSFAPNLPSSPPSAFWLFCTLTQLSSHLLLEPRAH